LIPLSEITAWRNHAPWPDDMQVEQDLLLSRAMAAIFSDDFLSGQVAMRGGTVLHKVHLAPAVRYSEDIDLVLVGNRPKRHIEKALRRVMEPHLGPPRESAWAAVKLTIRNLTMKSDILRMAWNYRPTISPQQEATLKIEVNCNEKTPFFGIVDLPFPSSSPLVPQATLKSYDIDEMLGTKMRALLQRQQGRDLFDLWWAWNRSLAGQSAFLIQPDRVVAAFNDYMTREGTTVGREEYTKELDAKMTLTKFQRDMDGMLHQNAQTYDIVTARQIVQETFVDRLR
jgi:predicted nucleotidyltransferase component of viral defense system